MKAIRLKNYRCFDDTGRIELKPLTFLVGANSSGKSSFLKLFPLLKQSIGIRRNGMFLWDESGGVDFDSLKTVLRDGAKEMTVDFELENFQLILDSDFSNKLSTARRTSDITVSVTLSPYKDTFDYISRLSFQFADQSINLTIGRNQRVSKLNINGTDIDYGKEKIICVPTTGLLPRLIFEDDDVIDDDSSMVCQEQISKLLSANQDDNNILSRTRARKSRRVFISGVIGTRNSITHSLKELVSYAEGLSVNDLYLWYNLNKFIDSINLRFLALAPRISYVQPLRAMAHRYYRMQNINFDDINSDGTNLAMYLYNLEEDQFNNFNEWLYSLFNFKVKLKSSEGHVQIMIEQGASNQRNMADVGFGFSQILPILAVVWRSIQDKRKTYIPGRSRLIVYNTHFIVIEQPELHLHPRFINLFANMLAKVISASKEENGNIKFIIETHSETLINRIGELIEMGNTVSNDDVSVLLFNAPSEGYDKYISPSKFSSDGILMDWPYGFFSGDNFDD